MNTATQQVEFIDNLYHIAHDEIHVQLNQLIPLLSHRQKAVKEYLKTNNQTEELLELIKWFDKKISDVLNINYQLK